MIKGSIERFASSFDRGTWAFGLVMYFGMWCFLGFVAGFGFSLQNWNSGGCRYQTLAQILNPGYIVTCEVFRKRFGE